MHFWIDKRSQAYGFGRARVAASLSGAGGNGLGFAHPPRRMGGKTTLMPTLHRLPTQQHNNHSHPQQQQQQHQQHSHHHQPHQQQQSTIIDCHRSHSINNNNNNNNSSHNSNHSHSNNNHHSNSNYNSGSNNNNSVANNNNFYSNSSCSGTTVHYSTTSSANRPSRACRSSTSINNVTSNNNNHDSSNGAGSTTRSYHHHPQFGNMSIRHHYQQSMGSTGHSDHTYSARSQHHHHHHNPVPRTHLSVNSASTVTSVSLPSIYVPASRSPSHGQSLEEGAMGMGPISTVRQHSLDTSAASDSTTTSTAGNAIIQSLNTDPNIIIDPPEAARAIPTHLKYGMWATLILASVFVAGAKFYADHQGTGLEVLIFAAFSTTFFVAACTVSLCRLPGGLPASPSFTFGEPSRALLNRRMHHFNHHYEPAQQQPPQPQPPPPQQENLELTPTGAPPPYHIAILLPENDKDVQFKDESPPPSYDKVVI